jgi:putative PIN family toxin of toxin-antitoxin system
MSFSGLSICEGIVYNTIMKSPRIVLDTNVVVAALRSRRGASFRLLELVGTECFDIVVSVPLILEYEDVLKRLDHELGLSIEDIRNVLDYLCQIARRQSIFYLWRPFLPDPKDDMVLEVAVAGEADAIVTFNRKDFIGIERFGLELLTPPEFVKMIGASR